MAIERRQTNRALGRTDEQEGDTDACDREVDEKPGEFRMEGVLVSVHVDALSVVVRFFIHSQR